MKMSESIAELSKALSKFQGEVKQPSKDGTNPHFRSQFVTLDGVVNAITETASKYGLSFLQFPLNEDDKVGVKTIIMHESGEFIEGEPIYTKPMKNDPQALGAVVTYLRRYSLSSIFGIASEVDDDAESAMNRTSQQPKQQYNKPQQQAPKQQPKHQEPVKQEMPNNAKEAQLLLVPDLFPKHAGKSLGYVWKEDQSYLVKMVTHEGTPTEIVEGILLMQQAAAAKKVEQQG